MFTECVAVIPHSGQTQLDMNSYDSAGHGIDCSHFHVTEVRSLLTIFAKKLTQFCGCLCGGICFSYQVISADNVELNGLSHNEAEAWMLQAGLGTVSK